MQQWATSIYPCAYVILRTRRKVKRKLYSKYSILIWAFFNHFDSFADWCLNYLYRTMFSLFHYNWEGLNTIMCSQVLYDMLIQFQLLFHPWFPMTCSIPQAYRCTYAQEYTNAGWQHDSWYPRIFWVSVIINCVRPILVVFGWISIAVFSSYIDFIKIIAVVVKIKMKHFA